MQQASFSGLLKTIIYIIGFYYLVSFLARIFLPIIMKKMLNKVQDNLNKQYQNSSNTSNDNTFTNTNKQNPKTKPQVGEYVDYEEID